MLSITAQAHCPVENEAMTATPHLALVRTSSHDASASTEVPRDVNETMVQIGAKARRAVRQLSLAGTVQKNAALAAMAAQIRAASPAILAANAEDLADARAKGQTPAFLDRLTLDTKRLEAVAAGVENVAVLSDPVGRVLASFERPNGLLIERVATPLGVIGVILDSRP